MDTKRCLREFGLYGVIMLLILLVVTVQIHLAHSQERHDSLIRAEAHSQGYDEGLKAGFAMALKHITLEKK